MRVIVKETLLVIWMWMALMLQYSNYILAGVPLMTHVPLRIPVVVISHVTETLTALMLHCSNQTLAGAEQATHVLRVW